MTDHNQQEPAAGGAATPAPPNRGSRRRVAVIGTAGAAVVLAGGAFIAMQANAEPDQNLAEPPVAAPVATVPPAERSADMATESSASPGVTSAVPSSPAAKAEPDRTATGTPEQTGAAAGEADEGGDSAKARKEVEEAREKAAADGVELQRPLKQQSANGDGAVNERTETVKDGTIRVVTAKHDLTGQRELALAADKGKSVGDGVHCTNKLRFAQGAAATERPTVLLCWRTSEDRSVVTMSVTPEGKPATATSVRLIDKEWAKLG
jgi:hypothetical protein